MLSLIIIIIIMEKNSLPIIGLIGFRNVSLKMDLH